MRTRFVAVAVLGGLLAACSADVSQQGSRQAGANPQLQDAARNALATAIAMGRTQDAPFANLPDRGALLSYESKPVAKGADTWHQVALSETHALRAVATGTMELPAPDGTPIRLQYDRSVEHGDGNWTWIGRTQGGKGGEAVITFGEKGVFGSIPHGNSALQVTTLGGKGYVVQTDEKKRAAMPVSDVDADFIVPNIAAAADVQRAASAGAQKFAPVSANLTAEKAVPASVGTTVDIVVGFTTGLATRLGSANAAITRIHNVVEIANTAYRNSQIDARLRLLNTVQVGYPDNTANRGTLFELTGVTCTTSAPAANLPDTGANCTAGPRPASLEPIFVARESYGADLAVLMRDHQTIHGGCGLGWMNGGGQSGLTASHAAFGYSVVSDSASTANCRNDTLAHETGHNMGQQHDVVTAAGTNAALEPEEFGVHAYSFGHSTTDFYTVMSVRRTGQAPELFFANPRIVSCGVGDALPCGDVATADNARSMAQTIPTVAQFRQSLVPVNGTTARGDFNADGQDDLIWRNRFSGANALWRSANAATSTGLSAVGNPAWIVAGAADFDGDNLADLLWRNPATGQTSYWRSGNSATGVALATVASPWFITGVGDFDGDNRADILWRHPPTGRNAIWRGGNNTTQIAVSSVGGTAYSVAGVADFDGDGRDDILWRNTVTGVNTIWRSGNSATQIAVSALPDQAWGVVATADFNNDNRADILWRNIETGENVIWRSGNSATPQAVSTVANPTWVIVAAGDFDGDGSADIVWRNFTSGANTIWRGGNSALASPMTSVPVPWWTIAG